MQNQAARRVFSVYERAKLVCWFDETRSTAQAARRYRAMFEADPPQSDTIRKWHKTFLETGSVSDNLSHNLEDMNRVRASPVNQSI